MREKATPILAAGIVLAASALVSTGSIGPVFAQNAAPGAAAPAEEPDNAADGAVDDELPAAEASPLRERILEAWQEFKVKWALGGNTMWALGFLAVIGLVFSLDRFLCLRRGSIVPRRLADRANRLWQQRDYARIAKLARRSRSSLGRVILFLVEHRGNPLDNLNTVAEDICARDFAQHARRNYPLSAVGTIAPLLGLMGTVFGLMGAFATIGVVGSMDDPAALADDIGKALITTAAGLIIAVPSLGLYHYFRSRTSHFAGILGEEVSNLMNAWFLKREADHEG